MSGIVEVARRAGVSISTVSNVLNNKRYVSPELVRRVEEAARELSYQPNPIASSMKSNRTRTIGVITEDMCGVFYPYVIKGINSVAAEQGYQVVICDTQGMTGDTESFEREKKLFRQLISNRVDGIIFVSTVSREYSRQYFSELRHLTEKTKKIPFVSLERDFTDVGIDSVYFDGYENSKTAVQHLIDHGCRRICHITGPSSMEIVKERNRGFLDALAENGLTADEEAITAHGDYTHQSGYMAMQEMFRKMPDLDGVFCDNDQMAVGALKVLKASNKKVPEDIKLIGYDDVFLASVVEPSLSTIHIRKRHAGIEAAKILFERIQESEDKEAQETPMGIKMAGSLVVRNSTVPDMPEDWNLVDW